MLICFNASPAAKEALDTLTATGAFRSVSEAISVALISYEALNEACPESRDELLTPSLEVLSGINTSVSAGPQPTDGATIPELFKLREYDDLQCLETTDGQTQGTQIGPAQWLFGQFNKFLPLKASCRCLANLQKTKLDGVPLKVAQDEISGAASQLGDALLSWDRGNNKKRDEALASAFPESTLNGSQGRLRFSSQFIGNIRQGRLLGFPGALRLLACKLGKDPTLSLTKSGRAFAQLENPVLDAGNGYFSGRRLSDAEIAFLCGQIKAHVPEEMSAYTTIFEALETGANTPDKIDAFLRKRFRLIKTTEITTTFLTTQRTGAISRMVDLDLIARQKRGLHVTYIVTAAGRQFNSTNP